MVANAHNIQYDSVLDDASGNEDASPDFYWLCQGEDHLQGLDPRDADPVLVAAVYARRSADVGHHALPQLPARSALPVLQHAPAARKQLLRVPLERPDRPEGSAARRAPGRGAVRRRQRGRRAAWRARHAAGQRACQAPRRLRPQVDAERRRRAGCDGEPGFLADRVRHGADRHEPALRAVLSREAAVLPRGRRAAEHADPGRLHAHDHGSGFRGAHDGEARQHRLHRARGRRRRGRQRDPARPERIGSGAAGLRLAGDRGARAPRHRPQLRRRPPDRSRGRRQRLQPRRWARLPASADVEGRHHRAVALQRDAEPEPARPLERVDGAVAELERGERALDAQHHALRRVHVLQRRRHRLPRQHGLRPAGRVSGRLLRDGLHGLSDGLLLAHPDLRHHRLPGRSTGRADLPAGLARRGHGRTLELVHAVPLRERSRAERRPDVPAAAVRLRRADEPVAAVSALQPPTASWARKWTSRTRARAEARR